MSSISMSATLLPLLFPGNLTVLLEMMQTRAKRIPLYAAAQPYEKCLSLQLCWTSHPSTHHWSADENITENNFSSFRIRHHRQQRQTKSDRWEMSTLSRSKVPQVWTPLIYRQSSNPCQRAVSLWADLRSASLSALTGMTRPLHGTMYPLSLSLSLWCFLSLLLSFSSSLLFRLCHSLLLSFSYFDPYPSTSVDFSGIL